MPRSVLPERVRDRLWPLPTTSPSAPPRVALVVLAVGAFGGLVLRPEAAGVGEVVVGTAVLGTAMRLRRRRPAPVDLAAGLGAVALLSVAAWRDAPWLVLLCLLGAVGLGGLAVSGGRSWTGVVAAALAPAARPLAAVRWLVQPLAAVRLPGSSPSRVGAVAGASGVLLLVFGLLFSAADPAYAQLVHDATGGLGWSGFEHLPTVAVVLLAGASATHLALDPPTTDVLAPGPGRSVRRLEWVVPLVLLDLLFASFVAVQVTVLFGGREHVLETAGLTYAEYARSGFWQLLVVALLTLLVLALTVRWVPAQDRRLAQALLGVLCLLSLVVVASASHRMSLYQQAYGWTRLRLLVQAVVLTLGALFVLLLVAGALWQASWLPRAAVALVTFGLLGLALLDPDAAIARHDVARFASTGQIDPAYLSTLSADAVPALLGLPAAQRACVLGPVAARLRDDPWYDGNRGRAQAREALQTGDPGTCR